MRSGEVCAVYFVSQRKVSALTHTHTLTLSLSLAWRGYVARQNLRRIKKEREAAAVRIQSGKICLPFSSGVLRTFSCGPVSGGKTFSFFMHFQKENGIKA